MRILQVRFKNLNSLVGEWQIDLTHPAFAADGIFAITGPTGAGKTTILDAICLALYGRTPRLNKVTKSGNEIMSRQTGVCFAEVTFESQAGRYRCHWSQHRARKKPGGELQPPKHEITDADSGQVLETKILEVAKKIEKTTGMDFERFTRSMLLAQGGFDTFLKADSGDRAPILEQITGTEIYSRISMRVHERRSEERNRLNTLEAELDGIHLLSEEDEQQLTTSLEQKSHQDAELNQQISHQNQAITWLDGIARLEKESKQLGQQKDDLQTQLDAFAPEQEKLRLASQALELAGDYSTLTSVRSGQEVDRCNLAERQKSLPVHEAAAKQAEEAMKTATEQLEIKKMEQQKALPVIRKVRELDLKVAEKDTPINAATTTIAGYKTSIEVLRTQQNEDYADLKGKRKTLENLLQQLEKTKADKGLVENLTGICGRFEVLQTIHRQLINKFEEISQTEGQLQEISRCWQEQLTTLAEKKCSQEGIQAVLAEKRSEINSLLEDKELADWRKSLSLLTTQKELLVKATEATQSLLKSKQTLDDLRSRKATLNVEESTLTEKLKDQTEKLASLEKEIGLLEIQLTLLKKIEGLEEARHQLQDGEPCPLCGAKEHPFAEGNIPLPDETQQYLGTGRADLKAVADTVSDLKVKLAQVAKDLEQVASGQKEQAENIDEANHLIAQACLDLPPDFEWAVSDPDLGVKLKGLKDENHQALEHATQVVQTAESVEKALNTLRESLEKAKELVVEAERETQAAAHKKDLAGQFLKRLKKEAEGLQSQQEESRRILKEDVQAFGVEALSVNLLDQIQEQLTARRDQWMARQNEKAELDQKIAALDLQTRHKAEQIQNSDSELKQQQELRDGLLRERKALELERQDIYGDKNPDDEEVHLSSAIDSAD
ncbi:Exonuclease SbcC, partial [hydrothermal vent metagenome]